jgi:hypothetical protein
MDVPHPEGCRPIRRQEGGYCIEGPGFYIWDEDPQEVRRVARDLGLGIHPVTPTQRMLIVAPQTNSPGAGRSEP